MLVVAKPKLCVFLGLLAWFASSVTWQLFFLQFTWNHGFSFFTLTTIFQNFVNTQHRTAPRGFFRFCCKGVAQRFSHCAQHCRQWRAKVPLWQVAVFSSKPEIRGFTTCISAWCVAFCFRSERVSRLRDHPLNLTKSIQLLQQVPHVVSSATPFPGLRVRVYAQCY